MPPKRGRFRPPVRRAATRAVEPSGRVEFARCNVKLPHASVVLRPVGSGNAAILNNGGSVGNEESHRWELICRDGWEWRRSGQGQFAARAAVLTAVQAPVVQEWIENLRDPTVWWAVSRELSTPNSSPEVAEALRTAPWLTQVFPVLLEACVEGAPPPPSAVEHSA